MCHYLQFAGFRYRNDFLRDWGRRLTAGPDRPVRRTKKLFQRIRTIKPEFFRHEKLFALEKKTRLPIRLAFIGLWTCCDREGKFPWTPKALGSQILPYDKLDFEKVLEALRKWRFIVKYRVNGEKFGIIPSWTRHQFINSREQKSNIPFPINGKFADASGTRGPRVGHGQTESVLRKGKEGETAPVNRPCSSALISSSGGVAQTLGDAPPLLFEGKTGYEKRRVHGA